MSGYVEITEEFIDTFGFELIGDFPSNDNEVVIPYYIFEALKVLNIVKVNLNMKLKNQKI